MGRDSLLLKASEVGGLLGVSRATVWALHSAGGLPLPVRLGGSTRWRHQELVEWVIAACPSREKWQAMKESS